MNYDVIGQSGTGSASDLARAKEERCGSEVASVRALSLVDLLAPEEENSDYDPVGEALARSPDLHRQTQRRLRPRDGGN